MVPDTFIAYFAASAGASAALIGLLFVAVSVAPERVFGRESTAERRTLAGSAFTALLNAFFVSLMGLIPHTNIGYPALILGMISLVNTLALGRHFWKEWRGGQGWPRVTLLLASVVIYGCEIVFAIPLIQQSGDRDAVYRIAYLLIGAFSLGIGRAWELLGAQGEGFLTLFGLLRERRDDRRDADRRA